MRAPLECLLYRTSATSGPWQAQGQVNVNGGAVGMFVLHLASQQ